MFNLTPGQRLGQSLPSYLYVGWDYGGLNRGQAEFNTMLQSIY